MIPIPLRWLTTGASLLAAFLGVFMVLGGLGLGSAALITSAPQQNVELAYVLAIAGLCNAGCSPFIWRKNLAAVLLSAAASLAVAGYFALRVADFGETFSLHLVLFALLTVVAFRLIDMGKDLKAA